MAPKQVVRGYELQERIGAGGFGEVYRAYQPSVGRQVAIKIILPQYANHPDFIRRFEAEARLIARLEHPHIVPLYDYWRDVDTGDTYLVMRWLQGGNLYDSLQRAPWAPTDAARLLDQIAGALAVAHRQGVVHRDVKPENILLDDDGNAYLSDFGIAKDLLRTTAATAPDAVPGSLLYIAPEVVRGHTVTPQSDLYSLGVVMYEVLTGVHPFSGSTPATLLMQLLNEPLPPVRTRRPDLPAALEEVIQRATAKEPSDRYPDALAFAAAFREAVSGTPRPAAPDTELPLQLPAFLVAEAEEEWAERPVFVARQRELAQLDRFLDLALAGQGRVAFVTGEAGGGKTSLLQEFTRRAQEAHTDLIAASGNCNAYTGISDPYLPFREILELLTGDVQARWAAGAITREHARRLWHTLPRAAQALVETGPDLIDTFVPRAALLDRAMTYTPWPGRADWMVRLDERKPATGPGRPSPQQSDLFEQYTRVLRALARRGPLLLVLDDLQWVDLGSISLLFHLGRQLAGSHILIVGAYRLEEVAIGRDGERHPLEPLVNEFQREFGDITLNLSQAESRDFVEALLDSEASPLAPNRLGGAFREMLYRQTHGHPLFTIELLRGLQERGDLVRDPEGRWVEGRTLNWESLPARVEAAIRERIGRLAEPLQAALRVASVEGEVFTVEVVTQVLGTDKRTMVQHLSGELDRRHRLVRAQAIERLGSRRVSRYRFRHILFQKYLYDNLDPVERAYLHEDVGNALEELYGEQASEIAAIAAIAAIAPQLARHFQEAGTAEKAIHYLHQAGERAVQLSAYQEGIAHLTRALALLKTLPDSLDRAQRELVLQLSLGMAWMGATDMTETVKAYTRARELCQQTGERTQLPRILGQLATMHYVRAEHQRARELAEEALNLAQRTEDPLLVALGHWHLGFVLFALGEYTAARAHLEEMIAFYEPQHHHALVFHCGSDAGSGALAYDACCLWCLGYPEQASKCSQEALVSVREFDHPFSQVDVLSFAGCTFSALRRDAQALKEDAEELMRLANEAGMSTWSAFSVWHRGEAMAMLGQVQEGMAQMREGIAACRSLGVRSYLPRALGSLAEAQAKAGHPEEGLATLAEALALVEQTDERFWEAELYRLKGELLLMQGDEAEAEASLQAESCLQHAIEVARRQRAKSWELRATTSLARLWQRQGKVVEAHQMLAEIYNWFNEGHDTADLMEAKTLLEELSS